MKKGSVNDLWQKKQKYQLFSQIPAEHLIRKSSPIFFDQTTLYRENGKMLFQWMMEVLKIFSFKTIISSKKGKYFALHNLTVINYTRYKHNQIQKTYVSIILWKDFWKLENKLSSSLYCYSKYGYPCFSVQITQ